MRKIGIALWMVAIILAASLSAILLRTNLLAGPPARPSSAGSYGRPRSPGATTTGPSTGPSGASTVPTTAPASAGTSDPTDPTTSPTDPSPATGTSSDLYQAWQRAVDQIVGNGDNSRSKSSDWRDFATWYQQLEAAYGRPLPVDVAFAWFKQLFGDHVHPVDPANRAAALACLAGPLSPRACAPGPGPGKDG
jgi:hypothetical protein